MRDLLTLAQLRLRLLTRPGGGRRTGTARRRSTLLIRALLLIGLAVFASVSLVGLLSSVVSGPLGRLLLTPLLTWVSSSAALLVFLFAVPVVLGAFTYNSDLRLLLLAPLSPRLLLGEKFFLIYGGLGMPLLVMGLVILIGVGGALGLGVGYDLMAVLALLVLPVTPLALAMLVTVAVLRWVPPARARTVTALLGALLAIGIYLGARLLSRSSATGIDAVQGLFAQVPNAWWSALPSAWPGRAVAAAGLGQTGTALAYLAGSVLLAAALAGLAILLSAHLFATGWATYQEVGRRARPAAAPSVMPASAVPAAVMPASVLPAPGGSAVAAGAPGASPGTGLRPAWWPLVGKEWRTLRRDTQAWARLLYPLFVLGFGMFQAVTRSGAGGAAGPGGARAASAGWLLITGLMLLYFLLVVLALPLVNREGRSLYVLALAPLSARDILLSKWVSCALPVLLLGEVVVIADAAIVHLTVGQALLAAGAVGGLVVALAGGLILVSLIWPRLDWDNPRRQVSAMASLVGSLGGLLVGGAAGILFVLSMVLSSSQPALALAAGAGIFVLLGLISLAVLVVAPRRLERLLRP